MPGFLIYRQKIELLFSKKPKVFSLFATANMSQQITIMLPYVYTGITQDYIKSIVCQLDIGTITCIELRPVGDHQQAFIHMDNVDASTPSVQALNEGQTLEVTYDAQGHYWKMVKYIRRGPSPEARARAYRMMKEREERESSAIKASIMEQEQKALDAALDEIAAEQEHLAAVVAGTADYNFTPTPEEQAAHVQPVIDDLTSALTRPTLLTSEEKAVLVRKFAAMMFYL
jgi:hypothetical protein